MLKMKDKRFLLFCVLMLESAIDQLADLEGSSNQIVSLSISKRVLNQLERMTDEQVEIWLKKNDFSREQT